MMHMNTTINDLQNIIRKNILNEGANQSGIPYVTIYRFTNNKIQMPDTKIPYIYLVLSGSIRLYTPSGIMDYIEGQYSISKIDTPLSASVISYSKHRDFLALSIEFSSYEVISTILGLDNALTEKIMNDDIDEHDKSRSDSAVIQSVYRLISAMSEHTLGPEFLRKNIVQEMIYHILCGSCGKQFVQSISNSIHVDEIYEINSWIKENFAKSFSVEELAKHKNMSISLFHQKFKNAVGMGPLQCQKRLRLTEARRLLIEENKNVTEASVEVGYESLSQFIRDYKKMFGCAPKEDIDHLIKQLKK